MMIFGVVFFAVLAAALFALAWRSAASRAPYWHSRPSRVAEVAPGRVLLAGKLRAKEPIGALDGTSAAFRARVFGYTQGSGEDANTNDAVHQETEAPALELVDASGALAIAADSVVLFADPQFYWYRLGPFLERFPEHDGRFPTNANEIRIHETVVRVDTEVVVAGEVTRDAEGGLTLGGAPLYVGPFEPAVLQRKMITAALSFASLALLSAAFAVGLALVASSLAE
jgi:hypothetical protein